MDSKLFSLILIVAVSSVECGPHGHEPGPHDHEASSSSGKDKGKGKAKVEENEAAPLSMVRFTSTLTSNEGCVCSGLVVELVAITTHDCAVRLLSLKNEGGVNLAYSPDEHIYRVDEIDYVDRVLGTGRHVAQFPTTDGRTAPIMAVTLIPGGDYTIQEAFQLPDAGQQLVGKLYEGKWEVDRERWTAASYAAIHDQLAWNQPLPKAHYPDRFLQCDNGAPMFLSATHAGVKVSTTDKQYTVVGLRVDKENYVDVRAWQHLLGMQ